MSLIARASAKWALYVFKKQALLWNRSVIYAVNISVIEQPLNSRLVGKKKRYENINKEKMKTVISALHKKGNLQLNTKAKLK